jgi:hypothetical protein
VTPPASLTRRFFAYLLPGSVRLPFESLTAPGSVFGTGTCVGERGGGAGRRIGGRPALALPVRFDTIEHLGLIYVATAVFVVGALIALKGLNEESR